MTQPLQISRRQLALIGIFVIALVLVVIATTTSSAPLPYDPDESRPDGLLALQLWLTELGFDVVSPSDGSFSIPTETDLIFSFPAQLPYTAAEVAQLYEWVATGGTLVLVVPALPDHMLAERFDIAVAPGLRMPGQIRQLLPLLPEVPAAWTLYSTGPYLSVENQQATVPVLGIDKDHVTAALRPIGQGHVWFLSTTHDLRNESLHDEQQAWLVPALLRTVPASGVIVFDTYHMLGETRAREPAVDSLRSWFYSTPFGWSLLATIGLTFLLLLNQGIRLGPSVDAQPHSAGRSVTEHVAALALLQQRTNQHSAVAHYHRQRLLTFLLAHYQLPKHYTAADLVAHLACSPGRAGNKLDRIAKVLDLEYPITDDRHLVQYVASLDELATEIQQAETVYRSTN